MNEDEVLAFLYGAVTATYLILECIDAGIIKRGHGDKDELEKENV